MKIYTKTGDKGETGLLGNLRVPKSHLAIKTCGALDETNSFIGLARSEPLPESVETALVRVQHDLFDLGARVAGCLGSSSRLPDFPIARSQELEQLIDRFEEKLPPLNAFILPSGGRSGSTIHLARSVCRRAERDLVELMGSQLEHDLSNELVYLNRMGDLLFILARFVNQQDACPETPWNVGRKNAADT